MSALLCQKVSFFRHLVIVIKGKAVWFRSRSGSGSENYFLSLLNMHTLWRETDPNRMSRNVVLFTGHDLLIKIDQTSGTYSLWYLSPRILLRFFALLILNYQQFKVFYFSFWQENPSPHASRILKRYLKTTERNA